MATKPPADLTSKTWNKLKEVTVPKTGFGAKLDDFLEAKKETEVLRTRNLAAYTKAADALDKVIKHIAVAKGKCNKLLHKSTIGLLGAYETLLDAEDVALKKKTADYQGYIDTALELRATCATEMKAHKLAMAKAGKDLLDAVNAAIAQKKLVDAAQLVKAGMAELDRIRIAANASLEKPRTAGDALAEKKASADDLGSEGFTALIKMQESIIAERKEAEMALTQALKDALPKKLPDLPVQPKK